MSEITIDTTTYERKTGKKPVGRAFWTFKIISPTVTFKDHIFTTEKPVTFQDPGRRTARGHGAGKRKNSEASPHIIHPHWWQEGL